MDAIGWAVVSAILCLVLAVLLYLKQGGGGGDVEQEEHVDHRL